MKTSHIFSEATFIARAKEKAKENDYHLVDAGKELAKEVALAYALYYGLWLLVVLGLLALLSFTTLLGGPFMAAQVIFFLIAGAVVLVALFLWRLWMLIKKQLHKLNPFSKPDKKKKDAHDADVIDGRITHTEKNNYE